MLGRRSIRSNAVRHRGSILASTRRKHSESSVAAHPNSKAIDEVRNAKKMMEDDRKTNDNGSNYLLPELADNTVSNFIKSEMSNKNFNEMDLYAVYFSFIFVSILGYYPKTCGLFLEMAEKNSGKKGGRRSKTLKIHKKKVKMLGGGYYPYTPITGLRTTCTDVRISTDKFYLDQTIVNFYDV